MRKNNRDRILETARRLFLKYGFNGISIRDIAAGARLTTGAIYFHFKSKRDIYAAICLEAVDLLIARFREAVVAGTTPPQKLISTYDAYLAFYYENREYYNILMEYRAAYESEDSDEIATKMRELVDLMAETIGLGQERNYYRSVSPVMISMFLASVAEGMLQFKKIGMMESLHITDNEFRRCMDDIVWNGIRREG